MKPRNRAAMIALANVLVERRPSDLKLGYFTVLTIIAERNTSTIASRNPQWPRLRWFLLRSIINSVNEATRPAAEGIGKPRNSVVLPLAALRQLNRARRNAP